MVISSIYLIFNRTVVITGTSSYMREWLIQNYPYKLYSMFEHVKNKKQNKYLKIV
jgi:hypothetical protein